MLNEYDGMNYLIRKFKEITSSLRDKQRYLGANNSKIGSIGKFFTRLYFCNRQKLVAQTATTTNQIIGAENPITDSEKNLMSTIQTKVRPSTNRPSFFRALEGFDGLGLEIGPLHAPICRRETHNIRYIDVFSTDELKTRYANDPNVPIDNIVDIDYVWRGDLYGNFISERFDYVVSSHNIEHVPCLIAFLNSLSSCLNLGGKIYLAIPDKRYCFDHFKPESSIAEVLDAYFTKRKQPLPWHVVRDEMLRTHNNAVSHWKGEHGVPAYMLEREHLVEGAIPANNGAFLGSRQRSRSTEPLIERLKSHYATPEYRDTHVWIITPQSFEQIMEFLTENLLVGLELTDLFPTESNSHEFYAILSKV